VSVELRIPGVGPESLCLALATPEGRIVALGGAAGLEAALVEQEGLERLVLEGTPWPGRTTLAFAADDAGGTAVTASVEGDEAAAAPDLAQLGERLAMLAGGAFALDATCRALAAEAYLAWLDPRALRAYAGVEAELDVEEDARPDPLRPKPGQAFSWRSLDAGEVDAGDVEGGLYVEVEDGRRLAFEWESDPGTFVEVRFHPVAALVPAAPAAPGGAPAPGEREGPRALISLTHTGFLPHALGAACARAARWLERLLRLCDYVDRLARVEEESLLPRAALEEALARTPPPEGALFELATRREPDRLLVRCVRPDVAGEDRPAAYEDALAEGRFHLARLLARAAGAPLHADESPEARIGPRGYVEEADIGVPPDIVFGALVDAAARARVAGEEERPPHLLGAAPPRALLEARRVDPEGILTLLRIEVARGEGGRTRVRISHSGFPDDAGGRLALRRERLAWAYRLLALRAWLEKGLDLAPLSGTRRLYPEWTEAEAVVDAPPAQVFAELISGAKARGETLLGGVDAEAGTALAVKRLERAEEVAVVRTRVVREGTGARLRVVVRGFSPEEAFWTVEERLTRLPGMALDRASERDRIEQWALELSDTLGGSSAIRLEAEADASAEEAWGALADPRRLAAWQGDAGEGAAIEPWPGGRFAWAAWEGAPAWSGALVEVDAGRRLVGEVSELARPNLFEVEIGAGDRARTLVRVRHTGFAGAAEARDAAEEAWRARLRTLVPWLEGRLERSAVVAAGLERAWAAFSREDELRAFLDPEARVEAAAANGAESGAVAAESAVRESEPAASAAGGGGGAEGGGAEGTAGGGTGSSEPSSQEEDAAPQAERAYLVALERGLGAERCAVLVEEPPRRLVLAWPCARAHDESLPASRLHVVLEEEGAAGGREDAPGGGEGAADLAVEPPGAAEPAGAALEERAAPAPEERDGHPPERAAPASERGAARTRVTLRVTDLPEGYSRPAIHAAEGRRLDALLVALAAHLARRPEMPGAAPPPAPAGSRRLEWAAVLPRSAPEAVYATVLARLASVYGAPEEKDPPRRLVYAVRPGPGEVDGLTRATVLLEAADGGGTRVSAAEEGFGEGPAWEERVFIEQRGWTGFLDALRRRDAEEGGIAVPPGEEGAGAAERVT
jgi:uncharacterized protein YndB with AHSA1/START domain